LVDKYGVEGGGWITQRSCAPHGCSLWKNIMMGWDDFRSYIGFDAGMGTKVLFWHDNWCTNLSLKEVNPVLYACSTTKDASIASMFVCPRDGKSREWNVTFYRDFNDWEMDSVVSFFHLIHSHAPSKEDANMLTWKLNQTGMFDTRSCYLALRDSTAMIFPWKSIWRIKAPRRVSFFVWTTVWGKILTCDNLMRGYVMVG
jgi:hypothetical protein